MKANCVSPLFERAIFLLELLQARQGLAKNCIRRWLSLETKTKEEARTKILHRINGWFQPGGITNEFMCVSNQYGVI